MYTRVTKRQNSDKEVRNLTGMPLSPYDRKEQKKIQNLSSNDITTSLMIRTIYQSK